MSYLVLARKFRPQDFTSIVGQEHITQALANAIVRGRVPHAVLFTGPRGVGKTTSARVLARALNCTGRELPDADSSVSESEARGLVEPCGECTNCVEIARSASMAVWEVDGASNNSVDNVRELTESLRSMPPPGSRYKIYIIDEVHMLSVAAFNALLKSLEEPPPNTLFIFATTEPHKIPETVISRCQQHDFRRLSTEVIAEQLRQISQSESIEVEPTVFDFVARKAQGGMRDAQSMFDRLIAFSNEKIDLATAQVIFGSVDKSFFFAQSDSVLGQDPEACFLQLDEAFTQSIDLRAFIADFIGHWRALLLLSLTKNPNDAARKRLEDLLVLFPGELDQYFAQLASSSSFDMQRLFDIAEKTAEQALRSQFPRFVLEAGIAKMATLPSLRPLPELLQQLQNGGSGHTSSASSAKASTPSAAHLSPPIARNASESKAANTSEPQAANTSEPKAANVIEKRVIADEDSEGPVFNPSWREFISHVKGRKEIMLATYLERVFPKSFMQGKLVLEATDFDLSTIREANTLASLKQLLTSYSNEEEWTVQFEIHQGGESIATSNTAEVDVDSVKESGAQEASSQVAPSKMAPIPGSMLAEAKQAEKAKVVRIKKEAQQDDSLQEILSAFQGSKVEKVSVLDK